MGLHHNTVRSHLEVLGEAGLVERHPEPRGTPGRPRMLYRAIRHTREGRYELLSKILAVFVAGTSADVGSAMDRAGRTWGRMLARADGDASHGRQVARLLALLDELGFEPELGPARAGGDRDVVLHACPFLEVAKERPDVVCSVHLGIMRGALGELGGLVEATGLDPFVEPDRCVAHLAGLDDGDGEIALEGVSAEVDP